MCFHKWGKWEQYEIEVPERRLTQRWVLSAAIEYRQKRKCLKCGKVRDELINQVTLK